MSMADCMCMGEILDAAHWVGAIKRSVEGSYKQLLKLYA